MSIHYTFGGSTAGRTISCPAWHNLSKNMPGGPSSMVAMEGTLMHLLFERGIEDSDFEPAEMVGESRVIEGQKLVVKPDHIDKVYTALECMEDIEDRYSYDIILPEVVMNTDDETGGTADIIAMSNDEDNNAIEFGVYDLKTGDGNMVWAEDNQQLLFYAWQAVEKYKTEIRFGDHTVFRLGIIQPSDRRDDPVDIWDTDLKTILAFGDAYKRARKQAKAGIKEPCAGSHCAYCPAAPTCPAKKGLVAAAKRIPKDSTELKDLQSAMGMVDDVEAWCRAVRKTAHEQAEAGVKLEGFKLVAKRATRQWDNPDIVSTKFKNAKKLVAPDYLDSKMKSPAQMEKVCKAKGLDFKKYEAYISLHSSGTTLVKDTDKRAEAMPLPALQQLAARLK